MNTERITVQHIAAALTLLLSVILVALAVAVLTVGFTSTVSVVTACVLGVAIVKVAK